MVKAETKEKRRPADIHRVSDIPVRSNRYEASRRVERRRSAVAPYDESPNTPGRQGPAEDVEEELRALLALLGCGERDQRVQHGAERYRTEDRPS